MKSIKFIALFVLSMALCSCLNNVHSDYTPEIGTTVLLCSNGDTLHCKYSVDKAAYIMDTMWVGDTLRFAALFNAMGNDLIATTFDWDAENLSVQFSPLGEIPKVLTAESDTAQGKFYYQLGYNFVSIPVTIVPIKEASSKFIMNIVTDSKFSPVSLPIIMTAVNRHIDHEEE